MDKQTCLKQHVIIDRKESTVGRIDGRRTGYVDIVRNNARINNPQIMMPAMPRHSNHGRFH
jgi:hypothetical protein